MGNLSLKEIKLIFFFFICAHFFGDHSIFDDFIIVIVISNAEHTQAWLLKVESRLLSTELLGCRDNRWPTDKPGVPSAMVTIRLIKAP